MKAIHNGIPMYATGSSVVSYPKDTKKWKQFTTEIATPWAVTTLCHIPKILKNESNSQHEACAIFLTQSCVISQRY